MLLLYSRCIALVELSSKRLEVGQVSAILPHTPRATEQLRPITLLVPGDKTVHSLMDEFALSPPVRPAMAANALRSSSVKYICVLSMPPSDVYR